MIYQRLLVVLIALVSAGALLTIGQIWGPLLPWDIYMKVSITLGILILLIGFVMVVRADLGSHRKLKDDNYLD